MEYPTVLFQAVTVTLANNDEIEAYWDGLQWWTGLENEANDTPILNEYIVSWR